MYGAAVASLAFISMRVTTGAITLRTGTGSAGSFEPCENDPGAAGFAFAIGHRTRRTNGWRTSSPQASACSTFARSAGSSGSRVRWASGSAKGS